MKLRSRAKTRVSERILLVLMLTIYVSCDETVPTQDSSSDSCSIVTEWQSYLESSESGEWEGIEEHDLVVTRLHTFGGENDLSPLFFDPIFIDVSGDTIIVADRANDTIVCFDSTGALLWKYGGSGEGPGFLLGIGSVSIGESLVSVINSAFGYVDIVTREGQFYRRLSSVVSPQNALLINDNTIAVFSKQQNGGDVHIVQIDSDSIIQSFGDGMWEPQHENFRSIWDIWATLIANDKIAYISQYEDKLIICDLTDSYAQCFQARTLPYPLTSTDNIVDRDSGSVYSTYYPVFSAIFAGTEGEVCVVLNNLMNDGKMAGSSNSNSSAPITAVDRYSVDGQYLASFCLPDSTISKIATNANGYYVAIQRHTGMVIGYKIE